MVEFDFCPPEKVRRFNKSEDELLPLKIDGHVVRRYKEMLPEIKNEEEIKDEIESINSGIKLKKCIFFLEKLEKKPKKEASELNVQQLLKKQKKLLNEEKLRIAQAANLLLRDPQENVIF